MRAFAIVLLSLGVIGGYGSALHHLRHGSSCGAGYGRGYESEGRWVPGHWEYESERTAAPAAPVVVAPAAAPAPVIPAPQIIVVQPQQAPAAPPTIVVQPPAQTVVAPAAPAVKTEPAKAPASE
jgi:hypothetical protein